MLTKTNKVVMFLISIVTIVLGLVTAIPFRTLPFASKCVNILNVEFIVKFIVIPLLALGASVYPNYLKYNQIKARQERSKIVNVLSYLPVLVVIIGLLVLLVHTLTFKYYPMSAGAHSTLLAICVCYLVFMLCATFAINKITVSLSEKSNYTLDVIVGASLVVFVLLSWRILDAYAVSYSFTNNYIYGKSNVDPYLFVLYIIFLFVTIFYIQGMIKMFKTDEKYVYSAVLNNNSIDEMIVEEYIKAYNDVLKEKENGTLFVAAGSCEEIAEEAVEEVVEETAEEVVEEVVEETEETIEVVEEDAISEEAENMKSQIDDEEAALSSDKEELEEYRAQATAEVQELLAKLEEIENVEEVEEEVVAIEKPVKQPKVFKPTFEEVVEFAESLKEEDWKVTNNIKEATGTGTIKYYKGKVLFLMLQKTNSDYRMTFLTTEKKWSTILTTIKGISIPKNAKGNKWLKYVNKGTAELSTIKTIVKESQKGANEEIAAIIKAKEEAKKRKAAEKKAAKKNK